MCVSKSGYYKWLKKANTLNSHEVNRKILGELILKYHKAKKSYGYRRLNAVILRETAWIVSDNLVHKVCKSLNIKSETKHYGKYNKPGSESIKYPNLIKGNWNTNAPMEKIVTDTTMITFKNKRYDWTFYVDVFNNEIVASDVVEFMHGVDPIHHSNALKKMLDIKIKRGYKTKETILHSDQGIIYSSIALSQVHKDYTITRSMSRVGTPTDNPIIESLNGWIKQEMKIDFNQDDYDNVYEFIDSIIYDYNYVRPSHKLKYKTPIEYKIQLGFK